jgi:pre-mRNA-processing factor SLU7
MDTSTQDLSKDGGSSVAEENFIRPSTDDSTAFVRAQQYAWETQESSKPAAKKLHLQANPTEGEILHKKLTTEAAEKKASARKALLDKYGGSEHLKENKLAKSNAVLASERYVEYDSHGHIKGLPAHQARSKYAEDVFTNNHTSVWGSWWRSFTWGYACCHSTVKNSYCTGDAGKRGFEDAEGMRTGQALLENGGRKEEDQEGEDTEQVDTSGKSPPSPPSSQSRTDTNPSSSTTTAKKRTLQELQSGITEEQLDTYKRNRLTADDPMASMLGRDELVQ